jgi:hypothetical protein
MNESIGLTRQAVGCGGFPRSTSRHPFCVYPRLAGSLSRNLLTCLWLRNTSQLPMCYISVVLWRSLHMVSFTSPWVILLDGLSIPAWTEDVRDVVGRLAAVLHCTDFWVASVDRCARRSYVPLWCAGGDSGSAPEASIA